MTPLDATGPAAAWCDVSVELGRRTVLAGVSLELMPGSWTALVGPNGSGKTTMVRALLGSVRHRGDVLVNGAPRSAVAARDLARLVAYVPQHPVFPPGSTVFDYVMLGRAPYQGPLLVASDIDIDAVARSLDRLDLAGLADRRVDHLSGGERQRAVLARAVAQDTPILVLDEPTTHLDLGHQLDLLELVDDLHRDGGRTVLTTLHDLTGAGQFADRVVVLAGGRIVAQGTPVEVLTAGAIAEHWGIDADVRHDGTRVTVTVRRRRAVR